jgi:hypothetical protein
MAVEHGAMHRKSWIKLLAEAFLIILSVMLALTADSWRQDRVNEEMSQKALSNIRREILENLEAIEAVLPHHRALLGSLQGEDPPSGIDPSPAFIQNNAWEAAQAMEAVPYMDTDVVSIASRIHENQRQYQAIVAMINEVMLIETFRADESAISSGRIRDGLLVVVAHLTRLELRLKEHYKEYLDVGAVD